MSSKQDTLRLEKVIGVPAHGINLHKDLKGNRWTEAKAKKLAEGFSYMYTSKQGKRTLKTRDKAWGNEAETEKDKKTGKEKRVFHTGPTTVFLPSIPKNVLAALHVPKGKDGKNIYADWKTWNRDEPYQIRVSMPRERLIRFLKDYRFVLSNAQAERLLNEYGISKDNVGEWKAEIDAEITELEFTRERGGNLEMYDNGFISVFVFDSKALRTAQKIILIDPEGVEIGKGHTLEVSARKYLDKMLHDFEVQVEKDASYAKRHYIDISKLPSKPHLGNLSQGKSGVAPKPPKDRVQISGFTYSSTIHGGSLDVPTGRLRVSIDKENDKGVKSGGTGPVSMALTELGLSESEIKSRVSQASSDIKDLKRVIAERKKPESQVANTIALKKGVLKTLRAVTAKTEGRAALSEQSIELPEGDEEGEFEEPDEEPEVEEEEEEEPAPPKRRTGSATRSSASSSSSAGRSSGSSGRSSGSSGRSAPKSLSEEPLTDEDL